MINGPERIVRAEFTTTPLDRPLGIARWEVGALWADIERESVTARTFAVVFSHGVPQDLREKLGRRGVRFESCGARAAGLDKASARDLAITVLGRRAFEYGVMVK